MKHPFRDSAKVNANDRTNNTTYEEGAAALSVMTGARHLFCLGIHGCRSTVVGLGSRAIHNIGVKLLQAATSSFARPLFEAVGFVEVVFYA